MVGLRQARAVEGARISTGNGNSVVGLLARGGGYVFNYSLLWRGWCSEPGLSDLWCSAVDLDRWWLKSEGLCGKGRGWLSFNESSARSGIAVFSSSSGIGAVDGWWEARRLNVLGVGWRHWSEARSVGCGLRAKLSEVKIGTSAVTDIHGLPETLLGVISVENDGVKQNRDAFENHFNKTAHQRPRLKYCQKWPQT
jgi:hypothetical protein